MAINREISQFSNFVSVDDNTKKVSISTSFDIGGDSVISGNVSFGSTATFGDDDRLRFGDNNELDIYYSGGQSFIKSGVGQLRIKAASSIQLMYENLDGTQNEDYAKFNYNGSSEFYYNGSQKFETTTDGFKVLNGTSETAVISGPQNIILDPSPDDVVSIVEGDISAAGVSTITGISTTNIAVGNLIQEVDGVISAGTTVTSVGASQVGISKTSLGSATNQEFTFANQTPTGIVRVKGDFYVDGTRTEINSTTLTVDDLNVVVASGATNGLIADGAGLTVDGADAYLKYNYNAGTNETWELNKNVGIGTDNATAKLDVDGTLNVSGISTFQDHVVIGAGKSIQIGPTGDQLSLEYDTNGTGLIRQNSELFLLSPYTQIGNLDGSKVSATFFPTGGVTLKHNNDDRLSTTDAGISVIGRVETSRLHVSGISTFASDLDINADVNVSGIVTAQEFIGDGSGLRGLRSTELVSYASASDISNSALSISGISTYNEVGILTGTYATDSGDRFGWGVACSADGNTIIVSADTDETGSTNSTGVVYVYDRVGNTFNEVGILTGSYTDHSDDSFGYRVATSADGKTIVVSDLYEDLGGSEGVVYVFDRVENNFNQVGILTGSLAASNNNNNGFGFSVATSADGKTIIVGDATEDFGSISQPGVVYVFDRVGNNFNEVGILTGSNSSDMSFFGYSVATSADGNTIVVGASYDDTNGNLTGSTYVFDRVGNNFNEVGILTGTYSNNSADFFGNSVTCSADGKTIVVGARDDEFPGSGNGSGVVYVYDRVGNNFNEVGILTGTYAADSGDRFGKSVATSADGKTIVVGAWEDEVPGSSGGVVYAFNRQGNNFNQVGILTGSASSGSSQFGVWVATSADGKNIIVGAHGTGTGAAYVFDQERETYVFSDANGNIGIGTANPTKLLDIDGTLGVSGQAIFTSNVKITPSLSNQIALSFNTQLNPGGFIIPGISFGMSNTTRYGIYNYYNNTDGYAYHKLDSNSNFEIGLDGGSFIVGDNGAVPISSKSFEVKDDAETYLTHNKNKKLETTGYGVSVTDGLNVSGISTFNNDVNIGTATTGVVARTDGTLNVSGISTFLDNVRLGVGTDGSNITRTYNTDINGDSDVLSITSVNDKHQIVQIGFSTTARTTVDHGHLQFKGKLGNNVFDYNPLIEFIKPTSSLADGLQIGYNYGTITHSWIHTDGSQYYSMDNNGDKFIILKDVPGNYPSSPSDLIFEGGYNDGVKLYHAGNKKLETVGTGISVYGNIDLLTANMNTTGISTISGPATISIDPTTIGIAAGTFVSNGVPRTGTIGIGTDIITGIITTSVSIGDVVQNQYVPSGTTVTSIGIAQIGISNTTTNTSVESSITFDFGYITTGGTVRIRGDLDVDGTLNVSGISTFNDKVAIGTDITSNSGKISFPTTDSYLTKSLISAGNPLLDYGLYVVDSSSNANANLRQNYVRQTTSGNYSVSVGATEAFRVSNNDGTSSHTANPGGMQNSEVAFIVNPDTSTELRYNYDKKLETTGYGVTVTGGLNVSGITTAESYFGSNNQNFIAQSSPIGIGTTNVIIGHLAGITTFTGVDDKINSSVLIGERAGNQHREITNSVVIGKNNLSNVTSENGVIIGNNIGIATDGAVSNHVGLVNGICIGRNIFNNTTKQLNYYNTYPILIGENILSLNVEESSNSQPLAAIVIGYEAAKRRIATNWDIYIGTEAGQGTENQSLISNPNNDDGVSGSNIMLGYGAGRDMSRPKRSVVIGSSAGTKVAANDNVIIGSQAGYAVTTGSSNILIGAKAGYGLTEGSQNIVIGSGPQPTYGSGSYAVGDGPEVNDTSGDRQLVIGAGRTDRWISGDSNFNIGIGHTYGDTINAKLDVKGKTELHQTAQGSQAVKIYGNTIFTSDSSLSTVNPTPTIIVGSDYRLSGDYVPAIDYVGVTTTKENLNIASNISNRITGINTDDLSVGMQVLQSGTGGQYIEPYTFIESIGINTVYLSKNHTATSAIGVDFSFKAVEPREDLGNQYEKFDTLYVNNVVGVAQSATKVYVDESEDDNVYYNIIFSDENPDTGDKYHGLQVDNGGLSFNPGTNTFYANGSISLKDQHTIVPITTSHTASAGVPFIIDAFATSENDLAEYTIYIQNVSNTQAQKVLVMHNGINAYSQEYGIVYHPNKIVSIEASLSGNNVLLQATPKTGISGITTYKVVRGGLS